MRGCEELRDLVHPFIDGELDVEQNVALLKHVELCAPCAKLLERERSLVEAVRDASSEPLGLGERRRILDGAFQRVHGERTRGRRRAAFLAAAALFAVVGLGLAVANPFCWGGCPTMGIARLALEATRDEAPLSLNELQRAFPRELTIPKAYGVDVEGGHLVRLAGVPERPLLSLRAARSGQRGLLVRVPGGHTHFWQERTRPDGRAYFETRTPEGMRLVGWRDAEGLWLCLTEEEVEEGSLFSLAAAVRDAVG